MSFGSERDRQRAHKEYVDFHRKYPKKKISFLDRRERDTRICETAEEMTPFIDGLLALADKAKNSGSYIHICLDVEGDFVSPGTVGRSEEPFYWHKRALRESGHGDEISNREVRQRELAKEWAKKSSKARKNQREWFRRTSREEGLIRSDAFSIQMACVEDDKNELVFAAHMIKVCNSSVDGGVATPPSLSRLFEHESILWINEGIYEDLVSINDSFFEGRLAGMRWIELKTIVESSLGQPMKKRDDIHGLGLLGMFQLVFCEENYSFDKDPKLCRSHWWADWSDAQKQYALMDVFAGVMILRKVMPELKGGMTGLCCVFPMKPSTAPTPSTSSLRRVVSRAVSAPFEFKDSDDEEDSIFMTGPAIPDVDEDTRRRDEEHFQLENRRREASLERRLAKPPVLPAENEDWNEEIDGPSPSPSSESDDSGDSTSEGDFIDESDVVMDDEPEDQEESSPERIVEKTGDEDNDYLKSLVHDELPEYAGIFGEDKGASPGVRGCLAQDASAPITHTSIDEIDVVSEDEFFEPLSKSYAGLVRKVFTSVLRVPTPSFDAERMYKSLPYGKSVDIIADAVMRITGSMDRPRRNYTRLLQFLANVWTNREKHRFMQRIKHRDPMLRHPVVIEYLAVEVEDLRLIICERAETTVKCLQRMPHRASEFLDILTPLFRGKLAAKTEAARGMAWSSDNRIGYFTTVAKDAKILTLAKSVSNFFFIEVPIDFRRKLFYDNITEIIRLLRRRKVPFDVAARQIELLSGSVAGDRRRAFDVIATYPPLRAHFDAVWYGAAQFRPPLPPPCNVDEFHRSEKRIIRIMTCELASIVVDRISSSGSLCMAHRFNGDYRYDENGAGAVGFTARSWSEVFLIFPGPFKRASKIIADAAQTKTIYCICASKISALFGGAFRLVEIPSERKGRSYAEAAGFALESIGIEYCDRYSRDISHSPTEMKEITARHLAAEVDFLSRCIPE